MKKDKQLSVFLRNVPGELGRFADLMGRSNINILAMFIQNAADYVQEMFNARGKSISTHPHTNGFLNPHKPVPFVSQAVKILPIH